MSSWVGGDGGSPVISITPRPAYAAPASPRIVSSNVDIDENLDDLIEATPQFIIDKNGRRAINPYYSNLLYIKANGPRVGPTKETTTNDILNGILDVISYGSAFASLVPFAPFKIGGSIGYAASSAGRAFLNGQPQAGLRYINQVSRGLDRASRYYSSNRSGMGDQSSRRTRR